MRTSSAPFSEEPRSADVFFDVSSDADMSLVVTAIGGIEIASPEDTTGGEERIEELISYTGPHMLRVEHLSGAGRAQLGRNGALTPWPNPDHGRTLARNATISGNADSPGDSDWYRVDLGKGQAITIDADAIPFDPALTIDGPDGLGCVEAFDDGSGGGRFGSNPRIVLTAREAGSFFVVVGDKNASDPGACRLSVD